MSACCEKARVEPSEAVTARSKHRNTRLKTTTARANRPQGHAAGIEKPKQRASSANVVEEAGKSFPHGVSSRPPDRESSNNRYHRGFAQ